MSLVHPHSDTENDLEETLRYQKRSRATSEESGNSSDGDAKSGFWFEDGDIVLCIETMLVRVHRRVLSRSPIWNDMLEIPQPDTIDMYDGLPLVELYGDAANDWIALLRWLYNPRDFYALTPQFSMISGALRLASKYDFPELRQWTIARLTEWWPHLELIPSIPLTPVPLPHASAIVLARETDVTELLPAAFYGLATVRWRGTRDGGDAQDLLVPTDLRRVIVGKEGLQDLMDEFRDSMDRANIVANPNDPHHWCYVTLERRWHQAFIRSPGAEVCLLRVLQEMASENISSACDTHLRWHREMARTRLERVIAVIPGLFSL